MNKIKKVFIIGASRTGSTYIARMLGNHDRICAFNELHFFNSIAGKLDLTDKISKKRSLLLATKLIARIERDYWAKSIESDYEKADAILNTLQVFTPKSIYDQIINHYCNIKNKSIAVEQTGAYYKNINSLNLLYPDAIFIISVRNPLAVISSQKERWKIRLRGAKNVPIKEMLRTKINYSPILYAFLFNKTYKQLIKFSNNKQFILAKYEEIVENPEEFNKKIVDKLKIDYDSKMIDIPYINSSFAEKQKPDSEKWKTTLNNVEIFIIDKLTKKLSKGDWGYYNQIKHPVYVIPLSILYLFLLVLKMPLIFALNYKKA